MTDTRNARITLTPYLLTRFRLWSLQEMRKPESFEEIKGERTWQSQSSSVPDGFADRCTFLRETCQDSSLLLFLSSLLTESYLWNQRQS